MNYKIIDKRENNAIAIIDTKRNKELILLWSFVSKIRRYEPGLVKIVETFVDMPSNLSSEQALTLRPRFFNTYVDRDLAKDLVGVIVLLEFLFAASTSDSEQHIFSALASQELTDQERQIMKSTPPKIKSSLYKILSIKPEPGVFPYTPKFAFSDGMFFKKHFKPTGKLKLTINVRLYDGQRKEAFTKWKSKFRAQLKKAGFDSFAIQELDKFNKKHDEFVNQNISVKASSIAGLGAFAKRAIQKGDWLGCYGGTYKESDEEAGISEQSYYFNLPEKLGGNYVVSGCPEDGGNALCRLNAPTTYGQYPDIKSESGEKRKANVVAIPFEANGIHFIGFFAIEDISGELFLDYGESYWKHLKSNEEADLEDCHVTKIVPGKHFIEVLDLDSGVVTLEEKSEGESIPHPITVDLTLSDEDDSDSERSSSPMATNGGGSAIGRSGGAADVEVGDRDSGYDLVALFLSNLSSPHLVEETIPSLVEDLSDSLNRLDPDLLIYIYNAINQKARLCDYKKIKGLFSKITPVVNYPSGKDAFFAKALENISTSYSQQMEPASSGSGKGINGIDGLDNVGNTCWLNAAVQNCRAMFRNKRLTSYLGALHSKINSQETNTLYIEFEKLLANQSDSTKPFVTALEKAVPTIRVRGVGHSSTKLMELLSYAFDLETSQVIDKDNAFFQEFGVSDCQVGIESDQNNYFSPSPTRADVLKIQLPSVDGNPTYSINLGEVFSAEEQLTEGNKWRPEGSKRSFRRKKRVLQHAPHSLSVNIDRKAYTMTRERIIKNPIEFYHHDGQDYLYFYQKVEGENAIKKTWYKVESEAVHTGGWHWVAYNRNSDGQLYEYDDRCVNVVTKRRYNLTSQLMLSKATPELEASLNQSVLPEGDSSGSAAASNSSASLEEEEEEEPETPMSTEADGASSWGSISKTWVEDARHPTKVVEHPFLQGMPKIDDDVIEKTKPYLVPLLKDAVISHEQADAVIAMIACNEKGSMCLLGDEPGLGKTRTLLVYLLIQHNLPGAEGNLLFVAPNEGILEGQEKDREIVFEAFRKIRVLGRKTTVPDVKKLYQDRKKDKSIVVGQIVLYLQTTQKIKGQIDRLGPIKAVVVDEVHKASSKSKKSSKSKPAVTFLDTCIQKVTKKVPDKKCICRAVFASATSITHAKSDLLLFWNESADSTASTIGAQVAIARLHTAGMIVARGLDLSVNLQVTQLKRVVEDNPSILFSGVASSPEQGVLTNIQNEIKRLRQIYTLLNAWKKGNKDLNLALSSLLKRLIEEEKLITLILNINKEESPHRHLIYVEGVGNFSGFSTQIFEDCQKIIMESKSEDDRKELSALMTLQYTPQGPDTLLRTYLNTNKYTRVSIDGSTENPPPTKRRKKDSDAVLILTKDGKGMPKNPKPRKVSWDTCSNAVLILTKKDSIGINFHEPLCGDAPEEVTLDIIGVPDMGETWEQLIGRVRRTGIENSKLQVKVWHLNSDPIPDLKSIMTVAQRLVKQTIFSKGGLSVEWVSKLLGRCHVWADFSNYRPNIQSLVKDSLSKLFGDSFKLNSPNGLLLHLELHEDQETARRLLDDIETFLCEKEQILNVSRIDELAKEDGLVKLVSFRQLTLSSNSDPLFAIKTYDKVLEKLMKKVIIPLYGFQERWIRFDNSIMPFWVISKLEKALILKLFQDNSELIDGFLSLSPKDQEAIINALKTTLKRSTEGLKPAIARPQNTNHNQGSTLANPAPNKRMRMCNMRNNSLPSSSSSSVAAIARKQVPEVNAAITTKNKSENPLGERYANNFILSFAMALNKKEVKNQTIERVLKANRTTIEQQKYNLISRRKGSKEGARKTHPFIQVCESKDLDAVKKYLEKNPPINQALLCKTALHIAAELGFAKVVEIVLKFDGVNVNAKNKIGETALIFAATNGHAEVVKILLTVDGVDVTAKDKKGCTALMVAAMNGRAGVVKMLVDAESISGRTAALRFGTRDASLRFAAQLEVLGMLVNAESISGRTAALMVAARKGHAGVVRVLVNAESISGMTAALMIAARVGHAGVVRVLLGVEGVDVTAKNKIGWTALMYAAKNNNAEVVEMLVNAVTRPEKKAALVNAISNTKRTALIIAATNGRAEVVKILLTVDGVDVTAQVKTGWTALMYAATNGRVGVVKMLVDAVTCPEKKAALVNAKNKNGWTALMLAARVSAKRIAARVSHAGVVRVLLTVDGVDVTAKNKIGETALMVAARNNNAEVVEMLVNAESISGRTAALMIAARVGHAGVVRVLLGVEGVDVTAEDADGWTALMIAAGRNHTEVVWELLKSKGIDVSKAQKIAWAALIIAAERGHVKVVAMLLAVDGVDVTAKTEDGRTALHLAKEYGHDEVVMMLVDAELVKIGQSKVVMMLISPEELLFNDEELAINADIEALLSETNIKSNSRNSLPDPKKWARNPDGTLSKQTSSSEDAASASGGGASASNGGGSSSSNQSPKSGEKHFLAENPEGSLAKKRNLL